MKFPSVIFLAISAGLDIVNTFLNTEFVEETKYQRRVAQLEALSRQARAGRWLGSRSGRSSAQKNWVTAEDIVRMASLGQIYEPGPYDELTPEAKDILTRMKGHLSSG